MAALRLLVLGPPTSPHVVDLAAQMTARGHLVTVAAAESAGPGVTLPESVVPLDVRSLRRRVAEVRELVAALRPDVVHAHVLSTYGFLAVVAGVTPVVATAWGSDVLQAGPGGRVRNRIVVARAAALTADSPALAAAVRRRSRRSVEVLGWGVDTTEFSPAVESRPAIRRRLGLPDGFLVLSMRPVEPLYNIDTVIAAFERFAGDRRDAHLVLKHYGGPGLSASELRAAERVHEVGWVPAADLPDYFRAADVCVSIPSSDSAPRSVWEAMAAGCPCILSDLPWLDGMIERGVEALVSAIDAQSLARLLTEVADDAGLRSRLAIAGRRLTERTQDVRVHADGWEALFRALAGHDGGPRGSG